MPEENEKPFEYMLLNVACVIGTVRMVIALYNDFTVNADNELFLSDLIVDLFVLVVFLLPIILTKSSISFKYISITFCFILTVLLFFNWFLTGGLESTAEYHMLAIFFLYGMILRGRWMFFFILLMMFNEIVLLYLWENPIGFIADLKIIPKDDAIHFISMAVGVTIGMLYLKNRFEAKSLQLRKDKDSLAVKYVEIESQNRQLSKYEMELESINQWLEKKVERRVEELEIQKTAINEYMNLSLKEVKRPLKSTLESLDSIKSSSEKNRLIDLLIESGQELNNTIEMIGEKLKKNNSKIDEG